MDKINLETNSPVLKNLQAFLSGRASNGTGSAATRIGTNTNSTSASDDVKRNRSANYSSLEKDIFLTTVQPYKYILEDKRFDSETLLRKTGAWKDIVNIFNSQHGVVRRDRKQLKELYKRLKDKKRREKSNGNNSSISIHDVPAQPSYSNNGTNGISTKVINITTSNGHNEIRTTDSGNSSRNSGIENNPVPQKVVWSQYPSLHALALASSMKDPIVINSQSKDETQIFPAKSRKLTSPYKTKSEGDGNVRRELTPEVEDRKPVIPTPPPLKDHRIGSPPPPSMQHTPMHSGIPGSINFRGNGGPATATNTPPPKPESVPQQLLCVRWGNYDSNIVSMFSKLRSQEHFVDVTLWCEGRTIKCHKMVLSACSTYFEQLLTETPNVHPIIFLKDMKFWEIEALVEFMYKGETSIHQDKLQSLLRAAESLQIKGLGSPPNSGGTPANNNNNNETSSPSNTNFQSSRDVSGSQNNLSSNDEEHSNSMDMSTNRMSSNHGNSSILFQNKQHMNMGIDLSNHSSNNVNHNIQNSPNVPGLNNLHPLALTGGGSQINNPIPVKRRKKETPRRIESLPRIAHSHPGLTLPLPLLPALYNSQVMQAENAMEDDDSGSEDELIIQEKNHIDIKPEHDMNYDDSNDGDGPENYAEQNQSRQSMDEDEESNGGHADRNEEMSENHDQGLAGTMGLIGLTDLRIGISNSIGNMMGNERDGERERSRKGNPIKKIHIGNNNNNNDTSSSPGIPSLIHNAAMD